MGGTQFDVVAAAKAEARPFTGVLGQMHCFF